MYFSVCQILPASRRMESLESLSCGDEWLSRLSLVVRNCRLPCQRACCDAYRYIVSAMRAVGCASNSPALRVPLRPLRVSAFNKRTVRSCRSPKGVWRGIAIGGHSAGDEYRRRMRSGVRWEVEADIKVQFLPIDASWMVGRAARVGLGDRRRRCTAVRVASVLMARHMSQYHVHLPFPLLYSCFGAGQPAAECRTYKATGVRHATEKHSYPVITCLESSDIIWPQILSTTYTP